jgi:hypothetical protein
MNNEARMRLLGGLWLAVVAVTVVSSMALGAHMSTSALLLVLGVAPVAIGLILGVGVPKPTVAEVLHAINTRQEVRR